MAQKQLDSVPGLGGLYVKAVAGSTVKPVLKRAPLVGGRFGGGKPRLPDTELVVEAQVEREHLSDYDRVCGFALRDELPPTYPHMLAFPLQMQLMTDTSFPFPVIGLVHIRNEIEQLRPIRDDESLIVRVHAGDLEQHPKGRQFVMHSVVAAGGEEVWRSRSTYLRKGGGSGEEGRGKKEEGGEPEPSEPNAVWDVPDDIGRRYAKVSGDSNPIHLRRSTAMAFGMPRPIAHGMWTKARCLAALEGELPHAFTVDVAFKLPVYLPSKVAFRVWQDGATREISVRDHKSGKPHIAGSIQPR